MSKSKLYLIDATAFCYRAFYALKGLSTSFGQPTGAIYGFVSILNKILKTKKPEYMAACFDVSRDTFRAKKFAEYKIQRPAMPDSLSSQIPLIKKIIEAYGITILEKEGYEADDIIATVADKAKEWNLAVVIVSSDKDVLQLVDENTAVFNPYKEDGLTYDSAKVEERFGVQPEMIPDVIALMGDEVDNIPGAPGIGEKTAVELLQDFGSLEKLLANTDKIGQEKLKKAVKDNIDKIKLSSELAVLDKRINLDFNLDKLRILPADAKELFKLFKYLEFKRLLKDLALEEESLDGCRLEKLKTSELNDILGSSSELVLYAQDADNIICCVKNRFFCFDDLSPQLKAILSNPKIKKLSHDLKKIKVSLAKKGIALEGLYFDTMLAAYLINPSKGEYTIVDLAWDYLGKTLNNESIDGPKALSLILELKPRLEEQLRDKSLWNLFVDVEMPLVEVLAQMELNGIKLDVDILKELSSTLEKRLVKLVEDIYEVSGCQFNINSTKQLREILFERLKLPVIKRSKTGPSTDEEVLRNLASQHKIAMLLLEYRQLTKLKSTYIDTLPDLVDSITGRVHTLFNQTATETGRLSSSNPNLQNIPIKTDIGKNIRRAIIASGSENYLLSCDYSQVELRILAQMSADENLMRAFKENKDIHKLTASLIYGLKDENAVSDTMRETAKRINFGIIYGLSAYGLSRDLGISIDEAQNFIDAYFLRYPKVKEYIEEQISKVRKDGFAGTILGRRRYIPEINNKNQAIRAVAERQAINTPIQGSASELIKLAMIQIDQQMKLRKLKTKMIIQIHDELVFDVCADELNEVIDLVKNKMETVLKLEVPIKVEVKKGKNWLEMEEVSIGLD